MRIDISVQAGAWPPQAALAEIAEGAVEAAAAAAGAADRIALPAGGIDGEVSIVFTDDASIRVLNKRWRGKDTATNVLSFALDGPGRRAGMLGDIVLAQETVAREAALEGKLLNHHIAHMIVHSFLHLLGYDHQDEKDAQTMEDLECKALTLIGIADPYACSGVDDD
ncbi:MAG: rRNA maturation RNase YbeY [Hyphomicrobiales bacterium]|nr:rRNA maturation RNase YbeY [Hyphomicrobiales bacterium]